MEAPSRIDRSTRFTLTAAATRRLGSDLLVNVGGATASVQRLMGTGPELWECFARGLSVGETADHLATREGAPDDVDTDVTAFATSLVHAGLAEIAR